MAITISMYNHTKKLFANAEVNVSDLAVMLLNSNASFVAANTSIDVVAGADEPSRANEVFGNGWTEGGVTLANASISVVDTNDAVFDADDIEVEATGGDIGPTESFVIYEKTSGNVLFYIDFGGEQTAGEGTPFKVTWNASGIARWVDPA